MGRINWNLRQIKTDDKATYYFSVSICPFPEHWIRIAMSFCGRQSNRKTDKKGAGSSLFTERRLARPPLSERECADNR